MWTSFSTGKKDECQYFGFHFKHKCADAINGGNSSCVGNVDTDRIVDSNVEMLLQVEGHQHKCKLVT